MTKRIARGFTLIELLVVIAIIGILASFLLANFIGVRQRARDGVRKSDLRQIQSALEMYRADKGGYPLTASFPSCASPLTDGTITYMQKIPCDPSGGTAVYTYSGQGVCGATTCPAYTLIACLENGNDLQLDNSPSPTHTNCSSTTWRYTLQNP